MSQKINYLSSYISEDLEKMKEYLTNFYVIG